MLSLPSETPVMYLLKYHIPDGDTTIQCYENLKYHSLMVDWKHTRRGQI